MDRLKELGTWVLLVIALWIFSNGIIYVVLNGMNTNQNNNTEANIETVNENIQTNT